MHELDLLLDLDGDAAVRAEWARLDEAGIRSAGRNPDPSNAPHLTLAYATDWSSDLDRLLGAIGRRLLPITVRLEPPTVWGSRTGSVVVRPVTDPALTELREQVAEVIGSDADDRAWQGHVTLARRISTRDAEATVRLCSDTPAYEVVGTTLRHWNSDVRVATALG